MIQLAKDFNFDIGIASEYYMPRKEYRTFHKPDHETEPKNAAVEYFKSRGICSKVVKDYGITTKRGDDNAIVFPFYDEAGESIPLIKYRAIKVGANGSKEWMEANCKPVLFGMNHCDPKDERLIITEGQIDSLSVIEAGIKNAVSVPGGKNNFRWVPHCWNFVNQFEEIVVFGDYERGEISLLTEITQHFGKNLIVKSVRPEDYKDCKDANDILRKYGREQVRNCVENAEMRPMEMLKDLADVTAPEKTEVLKTGIRCIDTILHGGLPFGLYHVITGKRGNGKSTLASQIFAQALNQGYSCMAYSGELPDYRFKEWLDAQIAGDRNMILDPRQINHEYQDYIVSASAQERINDWYRGRCFVYDNSTIHDENTHLLDVIDEAVRRYGVKVVLLDNLMTAVHKEENDGFKPELERQGIFCDKLADIAQETGALIILVAHRRKNDSGWTDASDNVSGSAQITNYAGVVISYDRYEENEIKHNESLENCRKLSIIKNRLYGTLGKNHCMMFSEKSRRVYTNQNELNTGFSWETEEMQWQQTNLDEIPFD